MSQPKLSVVVPILNEKESLRAVHDELYGVLAGLDLESEILYVDDGSVDGSRELLAELVGESGGRSPRVRCLRLRRHFGQTAALAAGFDAAAGDVVVAMDGDGQNDPKDIGRLLARLDEGFDVVSGWRRHRRDAALVRRLPSFVANRALARITGLALHDFGCTLKAYRATLLHEVRLYGDMHRFLPAHLHWIGARVTELEVAHRPRHAGRSNYGPGRVVRVLADLVLIRFMAFYFTRPMHFFGVAATWFAALAGLVGALMVVFKYGWLSLVGVPYHADFVQTPLPALAGSLGIGAVMSLFFGILGEILIRVLHEARGVPIYSVASTLDSLEPAADAPPAPMPSASSAR